MWVIADARVGDCERRVERGGPEAVAVRDEGSPGELVDKWPGRGIWCRCRKGGERRKCAAEEEEVSMPLTSIAAGVSRPVMSCVSSGFLGSSRVGSQ